MKFRSKTGEVLLIGEAVTAYCDRPNRGRCEDCCLYAPSGDQNCQGWATNHPHEAARLMGYEVVEDSFNYYEGLKSSLEEAIEISKELKEANMDKPLKDWTLGECQSHCEMVLGGGDDCRGCALEYLVKNGECIFKDCPRDIQLEDMDTRNKKPRWTEQEVERAKNLLDVVGPAELRKVADMVTMKVDGKIIYLRKDAFPTLKNEMAFTLDEIIGGAE